MVEFGESNSLKRSGDVQGSISSRVVLQGMRCHDSLISEQRTGQKQGRRLLRRQLVLESPSGKQVNGWESDKEVASTTWTCAASSSRFISSKVALGARCRVDGLHSECNRKCEQLARQLCELKSELDFLKVGSGFQSPRERDGNQISCPVLVRNGVWLTVGDVYTRRPGCLLCNECPREGCRDAAHHNGDCLFSEKARMPCDDMFHTTHDIEYNGGRRTEPQVLEDHLKADHPRLVRKVPPLNPVGASCFAGVADHPSDRGPSYGRGRVSKYWTGNRGVIQIHPASGTAHPDDRMNMYRRLESAGSGGEQMLPSMGEYRGGNGGHMSPRWGRVHDQQGGLSYGTEPMRKSPTPRFPHGKGGCHGGGGDSSREKILPPSQRYNFYRYYGSVSC